MNNISNKINDNFRELCKNLVLDREEMNATIQEITKKLNYEYYNLEKNLESHMYVVGSIGRNTAIKNSSDVDLLFDLPEELYKKYDDYDNNGQSALLQDVKNVLKSRYPRTNIRGDGQVVVLNFANYTVELVPCFKQENNIFKYPDTHDGGSWKYTDPLSEQNESEMSNEKSNGIYLDFCHILRSWKNQIGFSFKGLLIDTLVYNHFKENNYYSDSTYSDYLDIFKGVLEFLSDQNNNQNYWHALGSNQQISNDDNGQFVSKSKKALKKLEETTDLNKSLRELLGSDYPLEEQKVEFSTFDNTEEYIEENFPVDIKYSLSIDGTVSRDGFREYNLSDRIKRFLLIETNKKIKFFIESTNCPLPYMIYWKIRNVGDIAERKNMIRGQIVKGNETHKEPTSFNGPHYVECYLVKNGICVARSRIDVPIG